eukprot:GHVH01001182.1.p1 GENE.GHVH01001182.1~~GHVH01001182.1.p1  ORF type:complete len:175 (+),score=16.81 GHVH01001182.1:76-600(+)
MHIERLRSRKVLPSDIILPDSAHHTYSRVRLHNSVFVCPSLDQLWSGLKVVNLRSLKGSPTVVRAFVKSNRRCSVVVEGAISDVALSARTRTEAALKNSGQCVFVNAKLTQIGKKALFLKEVFVPLHRIHEIRFLPDDPNESKRSNSSSAVDLESVVRLGFLDPYYKSVKKVVL